jgi:hypothetical protein
MLSGRKINFYDETKFIMYIYFRLSHSKWGWHLWWFLWKYWIELSAILDICLLIIQASNKYPNIYLCSTMDRQELINSITDENQRNFIKISRLLGLSARSVCFKRDGRKWLNLRVIIFSYTQISIKYSMYFLNK